MYNMPVFKIFYFFLDEKGEIPDRNEDNLESGGEVEASAMEIGNEGVVESELNNDGQADINSEGQSNEMLNDEQAEGEGKVNPDMTEKLVADEDEAIAALDNKPVGANDQSETDRLKEAAESATTAVVEETNLTDEDLLGVTNPPVNCGALIEKLGYLSMTLEIFQKMRDTFGSEECEYCGRLFFSRVDYELHVRIHTGMLLNALYCNKNCFQI